MDDSKTSSARIIELDAFRPESAENVPLEPLEPLETTSEQEEEDALDFYVREEALFRQNIQLDLAHERTLMYRVALVILWIVAMILLRQWVMAALGQ